MFRIQAHLSTNPQGLNKTLHLSFLVKARFLVALSADIERTALPRALIAQETRVWWPTSGCVLEVTSKRTCAQVMHVEQRAVVVIVRKIDTRNLCTQSGQMRMCGVPVSHPLGTSAAQGNTDRLTVTTYTNATHKLPITIDNDRRKLIELPPLFPERSNRKIAMSAEDGREQMIEVRKTTSISRSHGQNDGEVIDKRVTTHVLARVTVRANPGFHRPHRGKLVIYRSSTPGRRHRRERHSGAKSGSAGGVCAPRRTDTSRRVDARHRRRLRGCSVKRIRNGYTVTQPHGTPARLSCCG